MLFDLVTSPFVPSLRNRSMSNYKMKYKMFALRKCFVLKSTFSILSVLLIPIRVIGINGGYFSAICRICIIYHGNQFALSWCTFSNVLECEEVKRLQLSFTFIVKDNSELWRKALTGGLVCLLVWFLALLLRVGSMITLSDEETC